MEGGADGPGARAQRGRRTGQRRVRSLMDRARADTGLEDFGDDSFREGLEVLVASTDGEAHLNAIGEQVFYDRVLGLLENRLQIEDWYTRHPEIEDQEIVAPLFGLGLPRTGSTALSFLLAQDLAARSLRAWESGRPCPPPEAATQDRDPRIAEAQAGMDLIDALAPEFKVMLPTSATGPTECGPELLGMSFRSQTFEGFAHIPAYAEWVSGCDMEPAYRFHRRTLKLLQWRCPPTRWRLKTPTHMLAIEALGAEYPDARFVMTHRDIASVIPSVASLMDTLSSPLCTRRDPRYLGSHTADTWELGLRRTVAFRDAGREARFFDVGFGALQADPLGTVRGLYTWLGEELTPVAEQRMQAWWEANPKDKHGVHVYRPEDYGIDLEALRERFRFYADRFDIPPDRR